MNSVENPLFLSLGWGCLERGEMETPKGEREAPGGGSGIRLQPHKCYFCVMFLSYRAAPALQREQQGFPPFLYFSCCFGAVLGGFSLPGWIPFHLCRVCSHSPHSRCFDRLSGPPGRLWKILVTIQILFFSHLFLKSPLSSSLWSVEKRSLIPSRSLNMKL